MAEPDIRVLVGTEGAGQIDGKSGKLIQKELKQIASAITGDKAPRITVSLDVAKTTRDFQKQLNDIIKGIETTPVKVAVDTSLLGDTGSTLVGVDQSKSTNLQKQKLNEKELLAQEKLRAQQELNNIAIKKAADDAEEKRSKNKQSDIQKQIALMEKVNSETLNAKFATTKQSINNLGKTTDVTDMRNQYNELLELKNKLVSRDISGFAKDSAEVVDYKNNVRQLDEGFTKLNSTIKITSKDNSIRHSANQNEAALKNLRLEVAQYEKSNDKLNKSKALSSKKDFLVADINSAIDNKDFDKVIELRDQYKNLKTEVKDAGLEGQNFTTKLGAQMNKLGVYFSAATVMMSAWRQVTQMVDNVVKLDKAMTELKKVTDETDASYKNFLNNAEARAKKLGSTLIDTINATADFARLGYNIPDAEKIADAALVYKNVGDGIRDVGDASESVISTMKAFGFEASSAMEIVDRFNKVGKMYAHAA